MDIVVSNNSNIEDEVSDKNKQSYLILCFLDCFRVDNIIIILLNIDTLK